MTKKKIIAILMTVILVFTVSIVPVNAANYNFTDINGHWARDYILYCCNTREVMTGISSTLFSPNVYSKRHEIVTTLGKIRGIAGNPTNTVFSDVTFYDNFSGYVHWANAQGIAGGTTPSTFAPNSNVTRQDLCVFIYRMCNAYSLSLPLTYAKKNFTDSASISAYASAAVTALQRAGLIDGYSDGTFKPRNNVTRGEFAKIVYELFQRANGEMISSQVKSVTWKDKAVILVTEAPGTTFTIWGGFNERHTMSAGVAKYYERAYYCSITQNAINPEVDFIGAATQPLHINFSNVVLRSFSWSQGNTLMPPGHYSINRINRDTVYYNRNNANYVDAAVTITCTGEEFYPWVERGRINLNVPAYNS